MATKNPLPGSWQRVQKLAMISVLFSLQNHSRERAASMPMVVGMMKRVMVNCVEAHKSLLKPCELPLYAISVSVSMNFVRSEP